MTVRIYRSSDASAPVLTGQVNSLTALLDAILVNGYGTQTAAGWSIAYTTTNKRAYQQNPTGANHTGGMFLYVDDTGPGAGGAKEARVCGFESMSAITPTGTGQFPTSSQSTIGVGTLVIRKSASADATARNWTCIANGQTIYLFIETGDIVTPVTAMPFIFGDFKSFKSGDQYAVGIVGRVAENSASANVDPLAMNGSMGSTPYDLHNIHIGHFVARHWLGTGGSVKVGKVTTAPSFLMYPERVSMSGYVSDTQTTLGASYGAIGRWTYNGNGVGLPFPNGPDGSLWVSPIWINHSWAIRGYYPGLWAPLHDRPLGHNDTFTASGGNLSGKSIIAQYIPYYNTSGGSDGAEILVEYSDTWI